MPVVSDFWLGVGIGALVALAAEAFVGVLITARAVIWWLERSDGARAARLFGKLLGNKELMSTARNSLVNGAFGSLGGRPPSMKQMARYGMARLGMRALQGLEMNWQKGPLGIHMAQGGASLEGMPGMPLDLSQGEIQALMRVPEGSTE